MLQCIFKKTLAFKDLLVFQETTEEWLFKLGNCQSPNKKDGEGWGEAWKMNASLYTHRCRWHGRQAKVNRDMCTNQGKRKDLQPKWVSTFIMNVQSDSILRKVSHRLHSKGPQIKNSKHFNCFFNKTNKRIIKNTVLGISDAHIWVFESPLPQELCEHLWLSKTQIRSGLLQWEWGAPRKGVLRALSYHAVGHVPSSPTRLPIFAWVPAACMTG